MRWFHDSKRSSALLCTQGIIDPNLEIGKLEKKKGECEGRLAQLHKRMAMATYAEKTPEAIKVEDRGKGAKIEAEIAQTLAAIADMQKLASGQ